ncbi:CheY-P phosphatase CheC [bioreactor metagenome]|uniref:CheY-P phosphatase CheC n=1 Tax=bioreactor metagenome TaxID=1076179 RepID=A0A644Y812_9ZZZZ
MANYHDLSELQLSVLSEIGNIGAGNAATSLASILADKVSMTVPNLQIIDVNSMTTILGGPENELAGILVNMTGDIKGMLLFLLDKVFVCKLINVLLEKNIRGFENITDLDMSAIMEIGNIMAGSYVSAISMLTNLNIGLSTPQLAIDMVGAILSYPAAAFGMVGEKLLFIEENFVSGEDSIASHLLIMPEPNSLQLIMESLEVC